MGNKSSASVQDEDEEANVHAKLEKPWRRMPWGENSVLLKELAALKPNLEVLRILLVGPTGAGKSSFINSVQRVLLARNLHGALESSTYTGASFTLSMKTHKMKRTCGYYPFEFIDVMGFEPKVNQGIQPKDIFEILEGHILDGYTFNPLKCISTNYNKYNPSPSLCDKVHCVVSILPADTVSRMEDGIFYKFREVRAKASKFVIQQVIVLTKVDKGCNMVNQDLTNIYHSRKIQEKVYHCSYNVGIPINCIYPVENYHAEITQDDVDFLILMALRDIVNFANDYVETYKNTER